MCKPRFMKYLTLAVGICWALSPFLAHANLLYNVSMNTSPLIGHPAGPFSLEFQLNDGSGTGDGNNTATLSNFLFGGGNAVGTPTLLGGASGDLSAGVAINDSSAMNEFFQAFTPGTTLSFRLELTTNVDSPAPDQFSFAILDSTGTELPSTSFATPLQSDVFMLIDINSSTPTVQTFAGDSSRAPVAGGSGIALNAPTLQAATVPEPGTLALLLAGLGGLLGLGCWRKAG